MARGGRASPSRGPRRPAERRAAPRTGAQQRPPRDAGFVRPRPRVPEKPTRQPPRFTFGQILRAAALVGLWGMIAFAALVAYFAWDLPTTAGLNSEARKPGISVLAADGTRLAAYGDFQDRPVNLSEMPPYLPQAVVAIEDRRFYAHFGLDVIGFLRALVTNITAGRVVEGGSTLTQQLAKILFLTPERSLKRKAQEALLALLIEQRYSKREILTIYLNRAYMGGGAYGVDAAAHRFFGKPAASVSLYEAALLAGALKAPSRLTLQADAKAAHARAKLVLESMVELAFIDPEQAQRAISAGATRRPEMREAQSLYFADWAQEQARGLAGTFTADMVVRSTLDPRLQRLAERALNETLADSPEIGQAALVALARDGRVLAMVGGRDYRVSQFNRATDALRQPGSAFKPVVFLAALEAGVAPDARVLDAPITVEGWTPDNFDGEFRGSVTLAEALARSLNSAAVRLSESTGRARVIAAARRLGFSSPLEPSPSLALGAFETTLLELTTAYAVFANGGRAVHPHGIVKIATGSETLWRAPASISPQVASASSTAALTRMLEGVITDGTGRAAKLSRPAAGKTGTSQEFRDAWFIGWSGDIVTGVWMGNDDNTPMKGVTGGGAPARAWRKFMAEAVK